MKALKLDHATAKAVMQGSARTTWRLNDEKNIQVNDDIELIDKVDPVRPDSWRTIGVAHVNAILQKRLGEVTADDFTEVDTYSSREQMLERYRGYYGEDVREDTPVKMISFAFNPYPATRELLPDQPRLDRVKLYADGGSRGNPGPSASGYVLLDEAGGVVRQSGLYLGLTTNNQAEYQALKFGLEAAKQIGVGRVDVFMDSMLVVNQMKGIFKIKNRDLWPIHDEIRELVATFAKVTFTHVPRELNRLADEMVNRTLDAELKQ